MAKITRALSIRQPYAELILRRKKKIEYRSIRTNIIGERIYVYASKQSGPQREWKKLNMQPGDLPTGVLIGTVVIKRCSEKVNKDGNYEWHLSAPERLTQNRKPKNQGQPVWFKPF
jgi:hypothetical protein